MQSLLFWSTPELQLQNSELPEVSKAAIAHHNEPLHKWNFLREIRQVQLQEK